MPSQNETWHVLIVEDHRPTARLISTAFDEVDPLISTHVVHDGRECLSVLRNRGSSIPTPDLVLLDLDLEDVHGLEVLDARREDQWFRRIPTIVFSGKKDTASVEQCYDRGANTFIVKPDDFDGYLEIAEVIIQYWFSTAKLPERTNDSGP